MKTKAFIVAKNEVIAEVETKLLSGEYVRFGYSKTEERIDASREWNLVNAKNGKISRDKKWEKKFCAQKEEMQWGKEINSGEFFIPE